MVACSDSSTMVLVDKDALVVEVDAPVVVSVSAFTHDNSEGSGKGNSIGSGGGRSLSRSAWALSRSAWSFAPTTLSTSKALGNSENGDNELSGDVVVGSCVSEVGETSVFTIIAGTTLPVVGTA